jgi:hypothetical protein
VSFDAGRALVIGIGTYANADFDAPATRNDAMDIAKALGDPQVAGYLPARVKTLTGAGAALAEVTKALDDLAATSDADDTVLVFYGGHGLLDTNGEYNLTTHDTTFTKDEQRVVVGTGLGESLLLEKLHAVKAQKLLLVINACFSGFVAGALGPGGSVDAPVGAPPSTNLSTRVLGTGEGRAVLTACRSTQESWFTRGSDLTIFGTAVGEGLRGKGRIPNAEAIGLWDFYGYVFKTTQAAAAKIDGGRVQEPVMSISELVGAFPIALTGAPSDTLGPRPSIASGPPPGTAADIVAPAVVDAARTYLPGISLEGVQFGAGVQVIDNSKVVDFGGAVIGGNVHLENIAKGDITITIGSTTAGARAASRPAEVRTAIGGVGADVARLVGVDDEKSDIDRELGDALTAADEGKTDRLLVKLDRAREQLMAIGPTAPAAIPLSETVSVLQQRARSLSG